MSCISGTFDRYLGPLIQVGIGPPGALAIPEQPQLEYTSALIDTGATSTCISPGIAQALNLEPIGWREMASATHTIPVNVYLVDLLLRFGPEAHARPNVQVLEFSADGSSPFQMLLGRDVLCQGIFTLSFDGHFTFSL